MSAQLSIYGPFFHNGQLVTAPRLYHYLPGGSQEKTAWSDYQKLNTAENPVVGNADGLVYAYFDGLYKIEVRASDESTVLGQWDNAQLTNPVSLDPFAGVVNLAQYGSLAAALSEIGTSIQTTLVVTQSTPIPATINLGDYPNIHFRFFGTGKFVTASGATLTLFSPGTIEAAPTQHIFDASSGAVRFVYAGVVHAGWFGAKISTTFDSAPATNLAIASLMETVGGVVQLQAKYKWFSTIDLSNNDNLTMRGLSRNATIVDSAVVGAPAIEYARESIFVNIEDFTLIGNNIVGASGSGHGIAMLDPTPDTGSFAPQSCAVSRMWIKNFKGNDSDGRGGTMLACAIAQVSTLENLIDDCRLDNCGHGAYIDTCFTPRIFNSIIIDNLKYGVWAQGTTGPIENLYLFGNDILNNGDSTSFAQTGWADAPTGNLYGYNIVGVHMAGNKFKNGNLVNFAFLNCNGFDIVGGFLRCDNLTGGWFRFCNGIKISGMEIDQSNGSPSDCTYLIFEMVDGNDMRGVSIDGVRFRFQGGIDLPACILIKADSPLRKFQGFSIKACTFGSQSIGGGVTTVTACIKGENVTLSKGSIQDNTFIAATDVTITNAILFDATTVIDDVEVGRNAYELNGGTITNELVSTDTFPQEFTGDDDPENVVVACVGSRFRRKNGGAGTSTYFKETGNWTDTGWVAK